MTPAKTFAWMQEVLEDAGACARLTAWEEKFTADLRRRVAASGERTTLSEAQIDTLKRIEEKVYACG